MTIKEVYEKFSIPPNLANHMVDVASICAFIMEYWTGHDLNWNVVLKAALLHDIGNIVRIDFDNYKAFGGEENIDVIYWKGLQKELIEKYGTDDHEATKKILEEIGVDSEIIQTIMDKSFVHSIDISHGDNWYTKILQYADLRVVPTGIVPMEERINDVKNRMTKYTSRPDFNELIEACRQIEKQIQKNIRVNVDEITKENMSVDVKKLLQLAL